MRKFAMVHRSPSLCMYIRVICMVLRLYIMYIYLLYYMYIEEAARWCGGVGGGGADGAGAATAGRGVINLSKLSRAQPPPAAPRPRGRVANPVTRRRSRRAAASVNKEANAGPLRAHALSYPPTHTLAPAHTHPYTHTHAHT